MKNPLKLVNNVNNYFKKLFEISFAFFLISSFFNINFLFSTPDFFINGFFDTYRSHFLNFFDFVFFISLFFLGLFLLFNNKFIFNLKSFFKHFFFVIISFLLIFIYSDVNTDFFGNIFRFFQFYFVFLIIFFRLFTLKKLFYVLFFLIFINIFLASCHLVFSHSAGLGLFGESNLNLNISGVSKVHFFGIEILRPYGFFSHPNVFSYFLVLSLFFVYFNLKSFKYKLFLSTVLLFFILFSFSKSLIFAVIFLILLINFNKSKKSLLLLISLSVLILILFYLLISGSESFILRLFYLKISLYMFLNNFLGVGISSFTELMSNYSQYFIYPWNFQPVHNVFCLLLNSFGLFFPLFLLIFIFNFYSKIFLFIKSLTKQYLFQLLCFLFIVLFSMSVDHYLYTSHQALFSTVIIFSVIARIFSEKNISVTV